MSCAMPVSSTLLFALLPVVTQSAHPSCTTASVIVMHWNSVCNGSVWWVGERLNRPKNIVRKFNARCDKDGSDQEMPSLSGGGLGAGGNESWIACERDMLGFFQAGDGRWREWSP